MRLLIMISKDITAIRRKRVFQIHREEINTLKVEMTEIKQLLGETLEENNAKTVDQFSTLENFRTRYNDLPNDVGDISA